MSYCRFGWDNSSVYIIATFDEHLECVGCRLAWEPDPQWKPPPDEWTPLQKLSSGMFRPTGKQYEFETRQEMLDHIAEHREEGDHVPEYVDERLREEIENGEA